MKLTLTLDTEDWMIIDEALIRMSKSSNVSTAKRERIKNIRSALDMAEGEQGKDDRPPGLFDLLDEKVSRYKKK